MKENQILSCADRECNGTLSLSLHEQSLSHDITCLSHLVLHCVIVSRQLPGDDSEHKCMQSIRLWHHCRHQNANFKLIKVSQSLLAYETESPTSSSKHHSYFYFIWSVCSFHSLGWPWVQEHPFATVHWHLPNVVKEHIYVHRFVKPILGALLGLLVHRNLLGLISVSLFWQGCRWVSVHSWRASCIANQVKFIFFWHRSTSKTLH